ncbi:precorrin-6A/cobalt-precorrin-6A reductase [Tateyamaria omphalii]|uniref:precorrin-6A/cobalt-precorrin-6A reductase n=1 Tax=Tateyamaria omphalii TaxID=299262 RepID=UPI001C99D625|nr:precorrin-6A/cobalt-precorrin-6A reductase [Tateyamaria omphalii]MBY5932352.1 precorrin-6A/cobalt-precorrin-6A reductase [Tateyamaria omphalii]
MTRLLILGGSAMTEPALHALAGAGYDVSVYWSRDPMQTDAPCVRDLRDGLRGADAIVDTTHPFDDAVRSIAARLAPDLPRVRLRRPGWAATAKDQWQHVATLADAVAVLPPNARVFAASGRDSAEVLTHHDGPVFLRQLHRHDGAAPSGCTYVFGAGPFDVDDEIALFREMAIDVVLVRNIGGSGSFPKLAAARALGLPAVLIDPPDSGFDVQVDDCDALLAWVNAL